MDFGMYSSIAVCDAVCGTSKLLGDVAWYIGTHKMPVKMIYSLSQNKRFPK